METELHKSREVPGIAWIAGATWHSYASSLAGRGGEGGLKAVISLPKSPHLRRLRAIMKCDAVAR
jgi:hypothetical protein